MSQKQALTVRGLAAMKAGEWANDTRPRGSGQLQARKLSTGDLAYYYRYTDSTGKQDRMPLGSGLSLQQAREQAAALSMRYQAGGRDLRRIIEAERAPRQEERKASLGDLLLAYVDALRAAGKVSAGAVEKSVRLHVEKPCPALWAAPAESVTLDDLLPILARMVEAKRLREAGKVRSYIRAAYAAAIRARQDATSPAALRGMGLSTNPARDLATVEGGNNARERALSLSELRAYWKRIEHAEGPHGALLRFHLLTGCQRIAQLGRITAPDWDRDTGSIRLLDMKGRRKKPRIHIVPLLAPAAAALDIMRGDGLGPHLFTVAHGLAPADYGVVSGAIAGVVAEMDSAGELEGGSFTPGDLRRTVETRLAAAGQSDEARGQLQSHGLGGVQNRHYNLYRYFDEKRSALEALYALVTAPAATVTPIRAARA